MVYVFFNCCQPGCSRSLHLLFHLMSLPCIVIGIMAAWEMDTITKSHFVTMHSWCGAATTGLIAFQVQIKFCTFNIYERFYCKMVFGLVCYAVSQCYKSDNQKYKSKLSSIHGALGLATFILSVASVITGITQTERKR